MIFLLVYILINFMFFARLINYIYNIHFTAYNFTFLKHFTHLKFIFGEL